MAGGIHSKTPTGYFETEYFQPWPGIDVSKPSSQIDPGACVSASGMSIRGALTNQPAIVYPIGSNYPIYPPYPDTNLPPNEVIALVTNLAGVTILITNVAVYSDFASGTATAKTFSLIYAFSYRYSQAVHFGSVVIGNNLYFSSAEQLGIYELSFTHAVAGLYVTNVGSGYLLTPDVTLTGGGGSGATATATVTTGSGGEITSYTVIPNPSPQFGGYHWLPTPTVTLTVTGGGGTGATAVANLLTYGAGSTLRYYIGSVTPTSFGSGYTSSPTVTITFTGTLINGPLPTITANLSGAGGSVTALTLVTGGSDYTSPPTVTIDAPTGAGGIQATGAAVLGPANGISVAEITAHNGSGPFIGANFLATIAQRLVVGNIIGGDGNQTGAVSSVAVVNGGTGYPNSGTISFSGGGGQNAAGVFAASGGVINSVVITNPGNGYNTVPTPVAIAATGSGFSGTATLSFAIGESSTTAYPDYFAWSAANAYGYFDPNSVTEGGGFDQLTEARGKITGLAVFESVCFAAHLGGFTQITVNTSGNIQPFTYNPLWSSDQGIICRFGSLAQYGAMCMFLGEDQPYQLSPGGLKPVGDAVASLLQNFSLWTNGSFPDAGLYGSIIEIEGEKHYLIGFSSDDANLAGNTNRQTQVYDLNIKTGSWLTWNYPGVTLTCPIYQSYDTQVMQGTGTSFILDRDNLLLCGLATTQTFEPLPPHVFQGIQANLGQVVAGQQLYSAGSDFVYAATAFNFQMRSENPTIGRSQTNRGVYIEYENLPQLAGTSVTLTFSLTGQPDKAGNGVASLPITVTFSVSLPYYALSSTVVPNMVLTATCQPTGTAFTATSQTLNVSSTGLVRLIKLDPFGETTQGVLQ